MIDWIDVKDKLPELNKNVLVFVGRYASISTGRLVDEHGTQIWVLSTGDGDNDESMYEVEFWAELNYPVRVYSGS